METPFNMVIVGMTCCGKILFVRHVRKGLYEAF